jgi:hypothetical protein
MGVIVIRDWLNMDSIDDILSLLIRPSGLPGAQSGFFSLGLSYYIIQKFAIIRISQKKINHF